VLNRLKKLRVLGGKIFGKNRKEKKFMKKLLLLPLLMCCSAFAVEVCMVNVSFQANVWEVQAICTDRSDDKKIGKTASTVEVTRLQAQAAQYLLEQGYSIESGYFIK